MHRLGAVFNAWPAFVATAISFAMIFGNAAETVEVPPWLLQTWDYLTEVAPEVPQNPVPAPDTVADILYAPVPGRDDRTPLPFVGHVFELGDPALPAKLSGIGPVFWDHAGQGTGAMIAPDVVLTTGHLFAERGKWDGPHGRTEKPPAPSDGRIYLATCGRAYDFKAIELGSMAPRARLGLDYAIGVLAEPVCDAAQVLPVAETPNDLAGAEDQILLNMGSYRFGDVPRYAQHPLYADRPTSDKFARYDVFGVRCRATGRDSTGNVDGLSTGLVVTSGCDGVPGGSGGPLVVSRDGGVSYSVVGVANSYMPSDSEYNNYTAVEGAFAAHLARFVDLGTLPDAARSTSPALHMSESTAAVLPMDLDMKEITQ
ncbi:MAG: hypothetical protein AAFQ58_23485 [Pseudomonadota bacterium]